MKKVFYILVLSILVGTSITKIAAASDAKPTPTVSAHTGHEEHSDAAPAGEHKAPKKEYKGC